MIYECYDCRKIFNEKDVIAVHAFKTNLGGTVHVCFGCYAKESSREDGWINSKYDRDKFDKTIRICEEKLKTK